VERDESEIRVTVSDRGKGIAPEKQREMTTGGKLGVGIRGMRERIRQLGGRLAIQSTGDGTCITARLPVAGKSSTAAAQA
jgi:signal transduction histidine kinase